MPGWDGDRHWTLVALTQKSSPASKRPLAHLGHRGVYRSEVLTGEGLASPFPQLTLEHTPQAV